MTDICNPNEYSKTVQLFADAFIELHEQIITIDECEDIIEQLRDKGLTLTIHVKGNPKEAAPRDRDPLLSKLFNVHKNPKFQDVETDAKDRPMRKEGKVRK